METESRNIVRTAIPSDELNNTWNHQVTFYCGAQVVIVLAAMEFLSFNTASVIVCFDFETM